MDELSFSQMFRQAVDAGLRDGLAASGIAATPLAMDYDSGMQERMVLERIQMADAILRRAQHLAAAIRDGDVGFMRVSNDGEAVVYGLMPKARR